MSVHDARLPGFEDPVHQAQHTFRSVLHAMAHPGRVIELDVIPSPEPLNTATTAVCLSLVDFEIALWFDAAVTAPEAAEHLRFHCGCALATSSTQADFALISDPMNMPALNDFKIGSDEQPELSTTLIIQAKKIQQGEGKRLSGPGINGETQLAIDGIPDSFWTQLQANHALYPRGIDIILTCGSQLAALPRTTEVKD